MNDICELIEPIKINRKPDQIAGQLKAMIAKGVLEPGANFPAERELSQAFCVSRASIREAIRTLENQRLIERINGRRVIVRSVTDDSIEQPLTAMLNDAPDSFVNYFEARLGIESFVVDLVAKRRTEEDLDSLRRAFDDLASGMSRFRSAVRADLEFHRSLAKATGNPILNHLMATFLKTEQRVMFMMPQIYDDQGVARAIEDHRLIYEGVRDRNATKAVEALADSLSYAMTVAASVKGDH